MSVSVSAADNTTMFDESMLNSLPGMGSAPPVLGSNIAGGSVFSNYVKARNDGQFFIMWDGVTNYEKPSSEKVDVSVLFWCSNMEFTDIDGMNTSTGSGIGIGYTARCVQSYLKDFLTNANNAGGQNVHLPITKDEFAATMSLSAVYVPQSNTFEGQLHKNTDNYVVRFWDDGQTAMPILGWEVYDAGDTSPNADTSSWSGVGKISWTHVDEAASLLGNDAEDFTPEKFTDIYAEVWSAHPPHAETINDTGTVDGELADEAEEDEPAPVVDGTEDEDNGSNGEEADDGTDDSSGTTRRRLVVIPSIFSTILGYF